MPNNKSRAIERKAVRRKAHVDKIDNRGQTPRPSVARAERKRLMLALRQQRQQTQSPPPEGDAA